MENEEELEEFLAHYGVKGMRWGVSRSPQSLSDGQLNKKIARAEKKVSRTANSRYLYDGLISRDFAYKAFEKKMQKKNPEWKTSKLPEGEMKRLMDKALNREQKKTLLIGAVSTAVLVGGAVGYGKVSGLNSKYLKRGAASVAILGGKPVVDLLISQQTAKKFIKRSDREDALKEERERRSG